MIAARPPGERFPAMCPAVGYEWADTGPAVVCTCEYCAIPASVLVAFREYERTLGMRKVTDT